MGARTTAMVLSAALASWACHPEVDDEPLATPPGSDPAEASGIANPPEATANNGISVGDAVITVEYDGRELSLPDEVLEAWVQRSASMVRGYLGEFPVPTLEITLVGRGFGGVGFGMHQDGRWITVYCGRRISNDGLENDWVMVHEMLHAAFPDLQRDHRWMQEGLSTYLEPIVRARAGNTPDTEVWRRWTRSMHHGRPKAGDRGLDQTHTWGRTYWGGALFWLAVDVELRKRTNNETSIRDIVRGILAEGGNGRANWSTRKVVAVGDAATGNTVLAETYAAMAEAPGDIDLPALFADLGVQRHDDGTVTFDDTAPMAHIRRAITRQ
ncbi:MAG: hypothetical protein AAF799_17520 [Myxococcota bacterium]